MKLAGDWLDHAGTKALLAALTAKRHQALFVGGCVRNALLGEVVSDIDLATDALPETVTTLAQSAGFRVVPTGLDHGTVTVIADGRAHEVTTFRKDIETDGRHAIVAFSTRIEDDAARRDFTINALYADTSGTVIDPLGGLPDLQSRRVRFVGDPETRLREDYLRILRFFRFHARYGDPVQGLDADGLAACAALVSGLESISKERIGSEMRKLLAARDPAPAVAAMAQAGVLAQVLPGADPRALPVLVHLEAGREPRWLRRLAVLGGEAAADRLRLSRKEADQLADLRAAIASLDTPAALGWRHGAAGGEDALLARAALLSQPVPAGADADLTRGATATFPVTAADLMPALNGQALGRRLKALETAWLASDLRLDRVALMSEIDPPEP
ncbi:MAG: CCA tRNA nucleotidyltransferase [Rhodobacterales bacterium 32-66-7]|nr:MAG: CCA tRNA nucleotidyltransferase [Rhodobacterales bacterium 32-66-7]